MISILLYEVEVLKYSTFQYYNYYFNTLEKAFKSYNEISNNYYMKVSINEINDTNIVNLKYKIMKGGQIIETNKE